MSLKLNVDTNPPVITSAWEVGGKHTIAIGQEDVGLEDFCELVKYVLTNTDLLPHDPRTELVKKIRKAKVTHGYMKGKKRYEIV